MRTEIGGPALKSDDGFRHPEGEEDVEYVSWGVENSNKQNVHYLHGGLHLFDSGPYLKKYTWTRTGITLIKQIRTALEQQLFPVVVTEGTSKEKKTKINHSGFLNRAYRSFANAKNPLFVYGLALSDNDEHLLKFFLKKRTRLYVSLFGSAESDGNRLIIERVHRLVKDRPEDAPEVDVRFFDASSAKVWG